eukprot:1145152-Pelagomonas_calceolata.AAC.1
MASYGRHGDVEKRSCAQKVPRTGELLEVLLDQKACSTSKECELAAEPGNVTKDKMGKIQTHIFRQSIKRMNGMSSSDRKCAPLMKRKKSPPLMICQPLTVAYSRIRSCALIPVAKVSSS